MTELLFIAIAAIIIVIIVFIKVWHDVSTPSSTMTYDEIMGQVQETDEEILRILEEEEEEEGEE